MLRVRRVLIGFALAAGAIAPASSADAQEAREPELDAIAEECLELLEEGEPVEACNEAPNPLLPPANELIWSALSFLVLAGLLVKFGLPAIRSAMSARTERIRHEVDAAAAAKAEADAGLVRHRRELADVGAAAAEIVAEARVQGDALHRDLVKRAEADAESLRRQNREQIDAERDRLLADMHGQVGALALDLAEQVVRANLDASSQSRLIDQYIDRVEELGPVTTSA